MKSVMTVIMALCLAATVTTMASATPVVTAMSTDIGGGLIAWDVFFEGNDGLNLSGALDLKFEGDINQVPTTTATLTTNTLNDFQSFEALGPDPVADSYMYQGSVSSVLIPFTASGVWNLNLPTGIDNPNGAAGGVPFTSVDGAPMWISSGTSGGVAINTEQIGHLVIDTTVGDSMATLHISGRVARDGVVYNIDQTHMIPEPSSIIMLSMGAVALVGFGWRRRRNKKG